MRNLYLGYNHLNGVYYLAEGINYHDRKHQVDLGMLDSEGLLKKLKEEISKGNIDPKRKSILSLIEVPEEVIDSIDNLFESTKISVTIGKRAVN